MLGEGDRLPEDMVLQAHDESRIRLSELFKRGRKYLVIYFYPKAFTPGCTREAIKFNELYDKFKSLGAEVIGVSTDSASTNSKFASRHGLRFKLVSDEEGSVCRAFGVLKGLGPVRFAERVTFIVGPDGRILRVIRGLRRAEDHAVKALEEIIKLGGEQAKSDS